MPRFFCDEFNDDYAYINGEDAKHIAKVLRMSVGESLTVCDTNGTDYDCTIAACSGEQIALKINTKTISETEPDIKIALFMALPKGDKFELIIQKAVELGVDEIVPVYTHRCVSRPDEKSMEKKLVRYGRVALEAAKQCGRGKIPQIKSAVKFEQAIEQMLQSSCSVIFYEKSTAPLSEILAAQKGSIAVMVGAEGGFEQSEIDYAATKGVPTATLGKRILRCETAPLTALSVIMYSTGNLG